MKKNVQYLFFLLALINVLFPIAQNSRLFTEKFNVKLFEKKYNNSQYVIPQSRTPISDEELLAYAGYRYATGMNPVLINSDHPPLGKYLIGWVTLLTGNQRIVSVLFALGTIAVLSMIIYYLTKSVLLVSIGVWLLTMDTMFIDQIIHSPILDIIQVFFLLLYLFFFITWWKKPVWQRLVLSGIALGCLAATKLYLPVFVVFIVGTLFLIMNKKSWKTIAVFLSVSGILTLVIYTASYFDYFLHGNSIRNFIGTQKWIFLFWKNNSVQSSKFIGDVLTLVLFNQWKVWWGNKLYIQFERWSIMWPIIFVAGFVISGYSLITFLKKKKIEPAIVLLSLWTIFFTLYLCFLPISPRYLLMLFFPVYIMIPLMLQLITKNKKIKISKRHNHV